MKIQRPTVTTGVYVSLEELVRLGLSAKGFSFLPRQPIHSILSGRHASRLRGRGMDFSELKPYCQGDDTHNIDWKATRRTGKSYVRIYNEERDRRVWIVVSQQSSLFFGSAHQLKSVSAAHAAALAIYRVLSVGDRVGAVVYNDTHVSMFKPQKSQQNAMRILQEIVEQNQHLKVGSDIENPGQFEVALKRLVTVSKHDDLIVLIGDGRGVNEKSMQLITQLAAHNDILSMLVYDPLEKEIPDTGYLLFTDSEKFVDINTSDPKFQQRYTTLFIQQSLSLEKAARQRAIPLLKISTHLPVLDQVRRELGHVQSSRFRQRAL